jgi:membrane-bound lytic murein transglycosylase
MFTYGCTNIEHISELLQRNSSSVFFHQNHVDVECLGNVVSKVVIFYTNIAFSVYIPTSAFASLADELPTAVHLHPYVTS